MVRHQRATCTDPVVARLDWYAGSPVSGQPHPTAALSLGVDTLAQALALWATRDDSKAQPEVRRAANTAVEAIDGMVAELRSIRSRLVAEVRQSDDAAMARSAELLARLQHERPGGRP
jgi:hypothetical protein